MKVELTENMIGKLANTLSNKIKQLGKGIGRETIETIHTSKLLLRLLQGQVLNHEEVEFLKKQGGDIGKSITLLGLQFIPGSSLAIIGIEKAGKKHGFSLFPSKQEIPVHEVRKLVRNTIKEYITPKDLKNVEHYADDLFSDVGVDVEFTKHFLDRVNDLRNKQDITTDELKWLYQKAHDRYANTISKLKPGEERVLTDPDTEINVPFVINWDGKSPDMDMIGKTVMRKKDFKSYTPKLTLEEVDDDTLDRMRDFGMDENDIDDNGYVTLYHGGVELPERLNPDEIFFLTNNYETAEMYAGIRGEQNETQGEVFIIKVRPEDVSWNTGSGEIEFDRGGLISRRNGFLTIIPRTEENIDVPINVGDTVLGGKFKNKKIVVKDIGKNEKGDITINNKPILRVRPIKEEDSDKKLTCLYIHGLGAQVSDDVKESLSEYNLTYPSIDYNGTTEPYYQCLEILKNNDIDFIIGHSIGGVMAFYLAKETNVPALLLCPAFGDKYTVYVSKSIKRETPQMMAIIGLKDDEVNPIEVKSKLSKQPNCFIKELNIGHDISSKNLTVLSNIFVKKIKKGF